VPRAASVLRRGGAAGVAVGGVWMATAIETRARGDRDLTAGARGAVRRLSTRVASGGPGASDERGAAPRRVDAVGCRRCGRRGGSPMARGAPQGNSQSTGRPVPPDGDTNFGEKGECTNMVKNRLEQRRQVVNEEEATPPVGGL